jgi:hypothetical protein
MGEHIYSPKAIDIDEVFMLPVALELLVLTFVPIYPTNIQTIVIFNLY